MRSINAKSPTRRPMTSQAGAALITSLVLLLVMTVLAITTMQTSTIEARMATNTALSTRAFQAAESAADTILTLNANDTHFANALSPPGGTVTVDGSTIGLTAPAVGSGELIHRDVPTSVCPGSSMGIAQQNTFRNEYFVIDASGRIDRSGDTLARSDVTVGVSYCIPAN